MTTIGNLGVVGSDDQIAYGGGVMRFLLPTVEATQELLLEYDILECWPIEMESPINGGNPARLRCGPECVRCTLTSCIGEPPPPTVTPIPASAYRMAVRKATGALSFGTTHIEIAPIPGIPGTLGPIFSREYATMPTSLESIADEVHTWLGVQNPPVVLHVYGMRDPRPIPIHPLHNRVIAIPVAGQLGPL